MTVVAVVVVVVVVQDEFSTVAHTNKPNYYLCRRNNEFVIRSERIPEILIYMLYFWWQLRLHGLFVGRMEKHVKYVISIHLM